MKHSANICVTTFHLSLKLPYPNYFATFIQSQELLQVFLGILSPRFP